MPEPDEGDPVDEAAGLGLSLLASIVDRINDGVFLADDDRRCIYVNPAACRILGRSPEQLLGRDYLDAVPQQSRSLGERYLAQLAGTTQFVSNVLTRASGEQQEVIIAPHRVNLDGRSVGAAFFRDVTETRTAATAAAALAQTAAALVGTTSREEVLAGITRHAVENTSVVEAAVMIVNENDTLFYGGQFGPQGSQVGGEGWDLLRSMAPSEMIAAVTGGAIAVGEPPGRAVVLPDAVATWCRHPMLRAWAEVIPNQDSRLATFFPVAWDNRVIGMFGCMLPNGVLAPNQSELAFCSALADHAAVAVAHARASQEAAVTAAMGERSRLSRELHDSVSQVLFAMTMHARAVELAIDTAGREEDVPLRRSVAQLSQLTRGALAEMRALVFELRPDALVEDGLVGALITQAAAISARESVAVIVHGPQDRITMDADVEQHVYRIVSEALHNVIKHAAAEHAEVMIRVEDQLLLVSVTDNGNGFDPTADRAGHLGLTTMAQRADAIGAQFEMVSETSGTTVSLSVPTEARISTQRGQA